MAVVGFQLHNNNQVNQVDNYPKKSQDMIDKAFDTGIEVFNYTTKATGLMKGVLKVVDKFDTVPAPLEEALVAFKSFKVIKGMLTLPKLGKSVIKIIKPSSLEDRFFTGWKIIKSIKKVVGAVETVFYYLQKLKIVTKAALAWTKITGYIFLPITFISTAISTYELGAKIKDMNAFRAKIKHIKQAGPNSPEEVTSRVCRHLLTQIKPLTKMKVITKDCPLKERIKGILLRLTSDNAEVRQLAADEGKLIRKRLKDRICEHVGVAAVDTSLSVAGAACTVLSLACPPAAIGLTIAGLALTVIGLANLAYSKFIPQGDIFDGEKRMLFSRVFKGLRTASNAVEAVFAHVVQKIRQAAQKCLVSLRSAAA